MVGVFAAAGPAPLAREDEHHDFAPVLLQRELGTVQILADGALGHPAREQVFDVVAPLVDHFRQFGMLLGECVEVGQHALGLLVADPSKLQALGEAPEKDARLPLEVADRLRQLQHGVERGQHSIDPCVVEDPVRGIQAVGVGVRPHGRHEGRHDGIGPAVNAEHRDLPVDQALVLRIQIDQAGEVGGGPFGLFRRQLGYRDPPEEALHVGLDAAFDVGERLLGVHGLVERRHERVEAFVVQRLPVVLELLDGRIPHLQRRRGDVDRRVRPGRFGTVRGSGPKESDADANDECRRRGHGLVHSVCLQEGPAVFRTRSGRRCAVLSTPPVHSRCCGSRRFASRKRAGGPKAGWPAESGLAGRKRAVPGSDQRAGGCGAAGRYSPGC